MPKLSKNVFLAAYPRCYSIILAFLDYEPNCTDPATGKILPSPNATVTALLKRALPSVDHALINEHRTVQRVLIADQIITIEFAKELGAIAIPRLARPPLKAEATLTLGMDAHIAMARKLQLL